MRCDMFKCFCDNCGHEVDQMSGASAYSHKSNPSYSKISVSVHFVMENNSSPHLCWKCKYDALQHLIALIMTRQEHESKEEGSNEEDVL